MLHGAIEAFGRKDRAAEQWSNDGTGRPTLRRPGQPICRALERQ